MNGIDAIKADIEWIKQTLQKIDERLDRMEQGHREELERIKDEMNRRLEDHEQRIRSMERFRYAVYGATAITWAIITALAYLLH